MKHPGNLVLSIFLLLLAAMPAIADVTSSAEESARCELNDFVGRLGTVPDFSVDAASAKDAIDSMSGPEIEAVYAGLQSLGRWQELPVVMASLSEAQSEYRLDVVSRISETAMAPTVENARALADEYFRNDMLFLVDQLAAFGPVMGSDFASRAEHVRSRIAEMPAEALPTLRQEWQTRATSWEALIVTSPAKTLAQESLSRIGGIEFHGCGSCCGDVVTCVGCWIDLVGCLLNEVGNLANQVATYVSQIATFVNDFFTVTLPGLVSKITELPGKVASFFTKVFNDIANFVTEQFNQLIAMLPDSVNEVLAFIGVNWDNVNWNTIASSIPTIAPPCPEAAVEIAAEVCDRGGDALTQLLFDVAPDDGLSFAFKLGAGLIHYPLAYLCQCNDIKEAIEYADAQAAHRELTETRLDLQLSTRATQASVNALSSSLVDLDSDVAKVEAKLDTLEVTADRIEDKIDDLTSGNSDQQDYLADFSKLMYRINIEENLLKIKPDVISLFQLSSAFGGRLETVAFIVADTIKMNLDANQATFGAERELQRGDALRSVGDFVRAYEAYRSAYSEAVK
jgi:cell division protein FtsB